MRKGFTLIELLIVIAIIAVLAVAFLPSVLGAPAKARDTKRMEDVKKIANFFTLYYATKGSLPDAWTLLKPSMTNDPNKLINASLSDFGGIFPLPDAAGLTGSPNYYYYSKPKDAKIYAALVIAEVENVDVGNVDASDVALAAPDVWKGAKKLGDSGKYYVIPIEK